jgi:hypothetical protein
MISIICVSSRPLGKDLFVGCADDEMAGKDLFVGCADDEMAGKDLFVGCADDDVDEHGRLYGRHHTLDQGTLLGNHHTNLQGPGYSAVLLLSESLPVRPDFQELVLRNLHSRLWDGVCMPSLQI